MSSDRVRWFVEASAGAPRGSPHVRCLIVEDDEDTRALLAELMSEHDMEVLSAGRADDALALCRGEAIDVALIDLGLPVVDGLSLCEALRRSPSTSNIGAVAYTGFATLTRSAEAAGFDAMVVKPVDEEDVVAVIRRAAVLARARSRAT